MVRSEGEIHGSEGGERKAGAVKRPHAMPRTRKGDKWEKNSSPFKKGVDMVYRQKKKSNQKQLGKQMPLS